MTILLRNYCLFALFILNLVFGKQVLEVPYDYGFTHECLDEPDGPQYGGGIVVNPELHQGLTGWTVFGEANIHHKKSETGNSFIVASDRKESFHSFAQMFNLEKDKLYTFSAWLQINNGEANIAAIFKTQTGYEYAGRVIAQKGCWSMLKGGLVVNASGPAHLYFESNNTNVEIWADSISLQPFTHEEWKSHQDQSIKRFRKGRVKVQALDEQGQPIANATVSIMQQRNNFPLGCAINQNILQNTAYQNWFSSRFKYSVFENEMKWYATEQSRGHEDYSKADALMQFAQAHGIMVRGHNVFWNDPSRQPSWVRGLSPNDLRAACNTRINSVMKRYAGQLIHWDVVNENLHFSFFESKLGPKTSTIFYQDANRIDFKAIPFLNEYNTIEELHDTAVSPSNYLKRISQLRQEGYTGPLGIGVQGHFSGANIPLLRSALEQLAGSRLPIWITELDVVAGPNQANFLDQILGEIRAHPAVQGIMIWSAWSPQGCYRMCLTDNNFNNLATGNVVDKHRLELSEGAEGVTDSNGFYETPLFLGEYEAKITHPDRVKSSGLMKLNVTSNTETQHFLVFV